MCIRDRCIIKGNGSNILIKDGGFRGLVIEIADNFSDYKIEEETMTVQADVYKRHL